MTTFYLFRLTVKRSRQGALFAGQELSNKEIILAAIDKKPSYTLGNGQEWRIGNIDRLTDSSVFFALGRITQSKRQLYDELAGNFVVEPQDEAPHTYVVVDLDFQICAIAQRSVVSKTPRAVANNLEHILNAAHSSVFENESLRFVLSAINDPQDFVDSIKSAYRVSSFTITFTRPNPIDVNEQFVKPMEQLLETADGQKGETTIKGESLRRELLEEMARSAAATGNDARATIQSGPEDQPSRRHSTGNPASVTVESISTTAEKRTLLKLMRETYRKIRGKQSPK